jgi:phosphate transport system substrate-binding protein
MKLSRSLTLATAIASSVVLAFAPSAQAAATTLNVGGASSVAGVVAACVPTLPSSVTFTYDSQSSGTGQTNMETGKYDFAYSDGAHTASQSGSPIPASEIHIPGYVWPIGFQYNLNTSKTISISALNVAKIFAGKIKMWNDPALVADNNRTNTIVNYRKDAAGKIVKDAKGNPQVLSTRVVTQKVSLPAQPITVIYRGDSSGTTQNMMNAFNAIDPTDWPLKGSKVFSDYRKAEISADPIHFQAQNKSSGVAALAGKTKYSITYAETNFAATNNLKLANVINANGDLVQPNADAANGFIASLKIDSATGIVTYNYLNANAGVYPYTVVTYALALTKYGNADKAAAVKTAIDYLTFKCAKNNENGFTTIDPASPLGKIAAAQIAKLGA